MNHERMSIYKVIIPYTESANPHKRFMIEYKLEAVDRETALWKAEKEFNSFSQYSSASWIRILDREGLRAWRIMPDLPQTAQTIDQLVSDLQNSDPDIIYNVLTKLGELEDSSYGRKIVPLLRHEDIDIAVLAAEALGRISDRGSITFLIDSFRAAKDPRLRASALASIIKLAKADDQMEEFVSLALGDEDSRVRANAVELVDKLNLSQALKKLVPMLSDNDNRVRANVLKVLWNTHDRATLVENLKEMIGNANRWMKISAIFVLRHIEVDEKFLFLETLSKDPDDDVQTSARNALFHLDDLRCLPFWLETLGPHSPFHHEVMGKIDKLGSAAFDSLLKFVPKNREQRTAQRKILDNLCSRIYTEKGLVDWLKARTSSLFSILKYP